MEIQTPIPNHCMSLSYHYVSTTVYKQPGLFVIQLSACLCVCVCGGGGGGASVTVVKLLTIYTSSLTVHCRKEISLVF